MLLGRPRRASVFVGLSCLAHAALALVSATVTGASIRSELQASPELAFPAAALLLAGLAAFIAQAVGGIALVRGRERGMWLVLLVVPVVLALGYGLGANAVGGAFDAAHGLNAGQRMPYFAAAGAPALFVVLAAALIACLLFSNAALLFALRALAAVPHLGRGVSVRVAVAGGGAAFVAVAGIAVLWEPMRYSALPAGGLPATIGLVGVLLGALAISGHHSAEDTLRLSLPPGPTRKERRERLALHREVVDRAASVEAAIWCALASVVASAICAGLVVELSAARGLLEALGSPELTTSARASRVATTLSFLDVSVWVHLLYALPALVAVLALVAAAPSHWMSALKRAALPSLVALLGAIAFALPSPWWLDSLDERLSSLQRGLPEYEAIVQVGAAVPLEPLEAPYVAISRQSANLDGRAEIELVANAFDDHHCAGTVARLRGKGAIMPAFAVAPDVSHEALTCLAQQALRASAPSLGWLLRPPIDPLLPRRWAELVSRPGVLVVRLDASDGESPRVKLEPEVWLWQATEDAPARKISGSVERRLLVLSDLIPTHRRVELSAERDVTAALTLRVLAAIAARAQPVIVTEK